MARKYYTIATWEPGDTDWSIQFGDYVKSVVEQEVRDMRDSGSWVKGTKIKIVSHADDMTMGELRWLVTNSR